MYLIVMIPICIHRVYLGDLLLLLLLLLFFDWIEFALLIKEKKRSNMLLANCGLMCVLEPRYATGWEKERAEVLQRGAPEKLIIQIKKENLIYGCINNAVAADPG